MAKEASMAPGDSPLAAGDMPRAGSLPQAVTNPYAPGGPMAGQTQPPMHMISKAQGMPGSFAPGDPSPFGMFRSAAPVQGSSNMPWRPTLNPNASSMDQILARALAAQRAPTTSAPVGTPTTPTTPQSTTAWWNNPSLAKTQQPAKAPSLESMSPAPPKPVEKTPEQTAADKAYQDWMQGLSG